MTTAPVPLVARTVTLGGLWRGIGFRLSLPEQLVSVATEQLPPGWVPRSPRTNEASWSVCAEPNGWRARGPGAVESPVPSAEDALAQVMSYLELHVAEHATGVIAVHAGVVAWQGRAILLPGRSMAGKSTLVHRLVAAGAQYCSDEYALLARDGSVLAYPRALSLRGSNGGQPSRIPVGQLSEVPAEPLPVGVVAALEYRPEAGWQVNRTAAAEGAMALLANTVAGRSRPVEAMVHVCAAAAGTVAVQGFRGDADEAAGQLIRLMQHDAWTTHE